MTVTNILKICALLALLSTEAWLLSPFKGFHELKWDALAAFFTALGVYFVLERESQKAPAEGEAPGRHNDGALFRELRQALPADTIQLLREHDFGGSFLNEYVKPLFRFVDEWRSPDKEFSDRELEAKRVELYGAAQKLSRTLGLKTTTINDRVASVRPPNTRDPDAEWIERDARMLNDLATTFVERYEEMVRLGRKKLPD